MTKLQGAFVWYELMTSDPEAAKAFYEPVTGWSMTTSHGEPADDSYGFISNADGGMTGGILRLKPEMIDHGARPGWLGYVGVDDCDAAVKAVEEAGGRSLMPPMDIAMAGRVALVADCSGAPFYVMTPTPPPGGGESTAFSPSLVGRCGWNELLAGDAAEAIAFYIGLFGWGLPEPMDMGAMGKYQFITHDGTMLGAIMQKPEQVPAPPHWNYYFRVPDITPAIAATESGGGKIANGPMQVPTGDWIIQAFDPEGAFFCLVAGAKS